jgi:NTP pyrophosphatase (non-canonical NTP hydrolase)
MNKHIETLKEILSKEKRALTARNEAQAVWKHMKEPGSPRCKYTKKECLEISEREGRIAIKVQERITALTAAIASMESNTFQSRVQPWLMACFGKSIAYDETERNHRFLEEALELAQACDCTESEAHQLVEYVFNRPIGDKPQEVGGVMVTLAALCLAHDMDMHQSGETELSRIWTRMEQIRAKQASKPKHSPLPGTVEGIEK